MVKRDVIARWWIQIKNEKKESGQALVEFAMVLPILLLLVFGIFEFGRIFHASLAVNNAAREGVRQGVVTDNGRETRIKQIVVITGSSIGLEDINVDVTSVPAVGSPGITSLDDLDRGDSLTVTVHYDVKLVTPIISRILSNDGDDLYRVDGAAVMMVE